MGAPKDSYFGVPHSVLLGIPKDTQVSTHCVKWADLLAEVSADWLLFVPHVEGDSGSRLADVAWPKNTSQASWEPLLLLLSRYA